MGWDMDGVWPWWLTVARWATAEETIDRRDEHFSELQTADFYIDIRRSGNGGQPQHRHGAVVWWAKCS